MNTIILDIKVLFTEKRMNSILFFAIKKASNRLKTKDLVYEYDWDSMPGHHAIWIKETILDIPASYASEYSNENLIRLEELGLIELIKHTRNEQEGTDKYHYLIK